MFSVLECVVYQHDLRLVLVAALVCILGNICLFIILNRSTFCVDTRRRHWLVVAAIAQGVGVWATHFVAMLAYRGSMPIRFDASLTISSVAIAIGFFWAAFRWLGAAPTARDCVISGAGAAIGVAAMHFTGMASIIAPARVTYDAVPILVSAALSWACFSGALLVFSRASGWRRIAVPAALSVLAIVALHFTAMSATTLVPDPTRGADLAGYASRDWLVPAIVFANFALIALAVTGSLVDRWLTDAHGLAEATLEALAITHDGRIVEVNGQLCELAGVSSGALLGSAPGDWFAAIDGGAFDIPDGYSAEARLRNSPDEDQILEIATRTIEYRGRSCQVIAIRDLSDRKRAQRAIEHLASHDPLTDLSNRAHFIHALDAAIEAKQPFGLLALDLDRFKAVNDIFGHGAGDEILCRIADILRASVRGDDLVARIGGDEFLIIQTAVSSPDDTRKLASRIRMQGMSGRYTQLLSDGLPLYGGQPSSIGLLQIPPTDLGQVEVIKGSASALYGPSALGGVINLVSRRPKPEIEAELLLNATTRDGQDITGYTSGPLAANWSYSLTGGYHRQTRKDLDDDGWIDMPGFDRWTVRPRLFWEGDDGATALITVGATHEDRTGGTLADRTAPDGQPFPLTQNSRRLDAGLVAEFPVENLGKIGVRASAMTQRHRQLFGTSAETDKQHTFFAETSLAGESGPTNWLAGAAFQADLYRSRAFPSFDYSYTVPGLFGQVEQELTDELLLAGSARVDFHSDYGTRFSPRLSALYRPGPWTIRASIGKGFYAPTPFVDEIEAAGLSRLEPLGPLKAETAKTASLDFGYAKGPIEASFTLFASDIDNAVQLQDVDADSVRLVNALGTTRTRGGELMLRYRWQGFSVTGSYVFVDASEPDPSGTVRRTTPRTPRHTAGLVGMWEEHGKGRIGIEAYYTGRQQLDDNPYRTRSRPYFELGALGEITLGKISLFVNAENILNIRQTKYDPLLLPQRAPDGSWTVDAWAPTDGFVVNGGIRFKFGGGH